MKRIAYLALCLYLTLCISCRDEGEKDLAGHFAVKGNAPFAQLVFVDENGRIYHLDASTPEIDKIPQGKKVRVHGRVLKIEMETADGRHTTTMWQLRDIRVVDREP